MRSLDIDMYTNGFNVSHIDCIHNAFAAACGYYDYENYFKYCFLHCIYQNYDKTTNLFSINHCDEVLTAMGLTLKINKYNSVSTNNVILKIANEIKNGYPVVLVTKYNSLFYNEYYKDFNFKTNHAIIINGYDDTRDLFTIKDINLIRDISTTYENSDIQFSINITSKMLSDIIKIANEQYIDENNTYANKFFSISQVNKQLISTSFILKQALKVLNQQNKNLVKLLKKNIIF